MPYRSLNPELDIAGTESTGIDDYAFVPGDDKRAVIGQATIRVVRRLARAKEPEVNARLDALHKAAHRIVGSADAIGLESLDVRAMTRSAKGSVEKPGRNVAAKAGLNRAMLDAGLGYFDV